MIESVVLKQFTEKKLELDESAIPLWPLKKKAFKTEARFASDYFVFHVTLTKPVDEGYILLNRGAERIDLFFDSSGSDGTSIFTSGKYSSKKFMRYNVGIYEFILVIDGDEFRLSSVKAEFSVLGTKQLDEMFQAVHGSSYFSLLLYRFSRANMSVSNANKLRETFTAWKVLIAIGEYSRAIANLSAHESLPFSRVRNSRSVERYTHKTRLSSEDIMWLASNPHVLELDGEGALAYKAIRYSPTITQTTTAFDSGATRENELINYCFERMKAVLLEMFSSSQLIPQEIFDSAFGTLSQIHDGFMRLTACRSARFHLIDVNQYRQSPYRMATLQAILNWLSMVSGDELPGGDRVAIPEVTTIFEYYCLVVIINSIVADGFELVDFDYVVDEPSRLSFVNSDQRFDLFYEPHVFREVRSIAPVIITKAKPTPELNPDFVLSFYESDELSKVFIIDAKFSTKERVNASIESNGHGPEIFYKYGLFLHDIFNRPVDAVVALYPSKGESVDVKNFREGVGAEFVKPRLITAAIPVAADISQQTLLGIKEIITDTPNQSINIL